MGYASDQKHPKRLFRLIRGIGDGRHVTSGIGEPSLSAKA